MSLFLSSGEASGDHYTAKLAEALSAAGYTGEMWGMGGIESKRAGIRVEWPGERLQLLGLTEVFSSLPSLLALFKEMVDRILDVSPEAVIVADSPDYHMRLIAKLRKRGYRGRIFYISPPTVWAWRSARVKSLRAFVDECLPLFGFEHEYLKAHGCKSRWKGHPLLEEFSFANPGKEWVPKEFANDARLVAFLPGSRTSEVRNLLPIMEDAAAALKCRGWHPVFSVAPGLAPETRKKMLKRFGEKQIDFYEGPGRDLLAAAQCAIGASGTVTVEALLLGCYMVVTYKLNPVSAFVARCVIRTRRFAMPNIIVGSDVFPELLQGMATAQNILAHALKWLEGNDEYRAQAAAKMAQGRSLLGETGVYRYWADVIMGAVS